MVSAHQLLMPWAQRASQLRTGERMLFLVSCAYPLAMMLSLWITWLAGWLALGHRPRPGLDDPKFIGPLVDVPYAVTEALLFNAPFGLLLGVIGMVVGSAYWVTPDRRPFVATAALAFLVLPWCLAVAMVVSDPLGVFAWYFD